MDISKVLNNEYVVGVLMIFTGIYVAQYRPTLPTWVAKLFKNDIFRVVYLSLLLMIPLEKAPHVSIMVALVFVLTLNYLNKQEMQENFQLLEAFQSNTKRDNLITDSDDSNDSLEHFDFTDNSMF
jgi:hypothetical protein